MRLGERAGAHEAKKCVGGRGVQCGWASRRACIVGSVAVAGNIGLIEWVHGVDTRAHEGETTLKGRAHGAESGGARGWGSWHR